MKYRSCLDFLWFLDCLDVFFVGFVWIFFFFGGVVVRMVGDYFVGVVFFCLVFGRF